MLRRGLIAALGLVFIMTSIPSLKAEGPVDIAPTGALRVAVAVGPAASAFWTTRDPSTGKPRGVTVELARAAADKLHVPLQLVEYQSSDEIAAASSKDVWDLSFMPADVKREQFVDQGPAYVAYMSGYLVRAGSDIRIVADVDRAGMRVGCIEGTSTSRTVEKSLKQAKLTKFVKPEEAAELIGKGQLDALAMGMGALEDLSRKLPGTKVLDEVIQSTGVVVVVPKGKAAAKAWAARFLDEAKVDGTVRRALDGNGFTSDKIAP
ncbi:transporter substrate-binding domain-containing protein [Bradyrhizobium japonicum]|uniref:transporter substrate-binding domain-containing protein n=1 Tax=Bradyrhizobium japonicum TaxID=375 RepID=UPI001BA6FBB7|nr:transporter substrate-binding domain-containing protein [Bradyrhizobium japonicum]MBR0746154.1 transporter substrate-binding domain-containing protein [Bradyrhizobium japonicum]MCP1763514.1 polar amino acid transport system substrate-binding protein [Bradyrhizobium japonicum]MCP1785651.1 polar amino acid transport system substrate-binding protein [Bradyrhizobium japonicum]MCP1807530.1 polar amino acid transport system substrate-binding protein [Bradyrhizobium japonicum]MCP1816457.1 polar am